MSTDPRNIVITDFLSLKGEERMRFLLQFAVLAPSTHNSQPWLFTLAPDACAIYKDPSLQIPYADPEGRDMYVSLGCAIENLCLATKSYGGKAGVSYGPFADKDKVAEVSFSFPGNQLQVSDPKILDAICRRINARGVFKDEMVKDSFLSNLTGNIYPEYGGGITVHRISKKEKIKEFANLTAEAMVEIYHNAEFRKEMSGWMNNGMTRKRKGIPGWALKMPLLMSFVIPIMVRYFDIGAKLASLNRKSISSAPLILVFTAPKNDRISWLDIGRMAERTMVECFRNEYQTSIFVASIEVGDHYKKVQKLIGTDDRPQFILAVGKIDSLHKPTPRFSVHDKMKSI